MTNPTEIVPGIIFYSYLSKMRKDKIGFFEHNTLVMQVSGHFTLETQDQTVSMTDGQMLLIRKNQLGEITKLPTNGRDYQTIVICLQGDMLRKIALEQQVETVNKYTGPLNVLIPGNDFLRGFFQSIMPYVQNSQAGITESMGLLKVREAVQLLLHTMPELKNFLFDFSEPHKIDLEKFMITNYHFNMPVEKFAYLTGRSLAGFKRDFQKTFGMAPRHWLTERRLLEALHLIEKKNKKPSAFYLDLGFESLSHFSHSFKKRFGKTPSEYLVLDKI